MAYRSRQEFLKKGIKPSSTTTHAPKCDICWDLFPIAKPQNRLAACVKYTGSAAKAIFFRASKPKCACPEGARNCRESTRLDTMIEIKACGHPFCLACLDKWLEETNTCPMCREVLFVQDIRKSEFYSEPRLLSSREYLEIRDMGLPAASVVSGSDLGLDEERHEAWGYREPALFRHNGGRERRLANVSRAGDRDVGRSNAFIAENELEGIEGLQLARGQDEEEGENLETNEEVTDHDDHEEGETKELTELYRGASIWELGDVIAHMA